MQIFVGYDRSSSSRKERVEARSSNNPSKIPIQRPNQLRGKTKKQPEVLDPVVST